MKPNNYAFIDSQNLNLSIRELGWKLDFARFRIYLTDKFQVTKAYIFIGYMPSNQDLYSFLQAMIDFGEYEKAVIITGDGDFYCLVNHLITKQKLRALLVPNRYKYSALLKLKEFRPFTRDMNDLRQKLEYKGSKKKSPHKDGTLQGNSSIGDRSNIAKKSKKVNGHKRDKPQKN